MREYFGIFATSVLHMYDQSRAKNAVPADQRRLAQ